MRRARGGRSEAGGYSYSIYVYGGHETGLAFGPFR